MITNKILKLAWPSLGTIEDLEKIHNEIEKHIISECLENYIITAISHTYQAGRLSCIVIFSNGN